MLKVDANTIFEAAHAHVAKWEGGFFDHPNDPGGVTMYGVSLMFLKSLGLVEGDIDGDGDIDRDDVLKITRDTAKAIFRRHFWDKPRAGGTAPAGGRGLLRLGRERERGPGRPLSSRKESTSCARRPLPNLPRMSGRSHARTASSLRQPAKKACLRPRTLTGAKTGIGGLPRRKRNRPCF